MCQSVVEMVLVGLLQKSDLLSEALEYLACGKSSNLEISYDKTIELIICVKQKSLWRLKADLIKLTEVFGTVLDYQLHFSENKLHFQELHRSSFET